MKRLHVSLGVKDLEPSVRFYTTLFGAEPTVRREGYAKWMLEDPRVNFVLDQRCDTDGVDQLGIQVEDEAEMGEISERLKAARHDLLELENNECCYAVMDKFWVNDPQGVAWESFKTHELIGDYGDPTPTRALLDLAKGQAAKSCC